MENRIGPIVLSADEASLILKTTLVTTRHLLATGQSKGRKVGKSWRIHPDALRAFLTSGEDNATQSLHNCENSPFRKEE